MKKEWFLPSVILLGVIPFLFSRGIQAAKEIELEKSKRKEIRVGPGEMGIEATVVEGPPIKADQILTKDHPIYARGMTCAECHDVSFDTLTSVTKQFILNFLQLP